MARTTTGKVSKVALKSNPDIQYDVVSQDKEKVVLRGLDGQDIEVTPKEYVKSYSIVDIKMNEVPETKATPITPGASTTSVPREGTKSEKIRQLLSEGKSVAEAAKATDSHYSFVWGVAQRYFKGEVPTATKSNEDSKSAQIRKLYDEGKTKSEIKKALLVDYSFVYSVVSAYELKLQREGKLQKEETADA